MSYSPERALTFGEAFDLPVCVDLGTAARAFGVCRATAYRLVQLGSFPCRVLRVGYQYRVPTTSLMRALDVEELPVYASHLAEGADHAARLDGRNTTTEEPR
ncbi:helix-turn-helix domain-containing protein [Kitasatospora sp. NPDC051170]|uniref:helix-turn-helix domain-containing protein n=1 Tax=Kitasatospora sp. NPDC051170 TaxID=3364056 RepID=UPI00379199D2